MDGNWSDENGNGYFDDGDIIIVTGHIFTAAYSSGAGGGGGGGGLGGLQDDTISITPTTTGDEAIPAAEPLPTPCVETTFATPNVSLTDANRAALAASNAIAGRNHERYEYSSIVFSHNGKVGFTEPYTNRSPDEADWMNPEIASRIPDGAVILGVVHNHPNRPFIDDSIPSGGDPSDGVDWQKYEIMVGSDLNLPRGISVDKNMLLYIYTNEDRKTRVYDKTDKQQTKPSCPLQ